MITKAPIIGIIGQAGSSLAKWMRGKGNELHSRHLAYLLNIECNDNIYQARHQPNQKLELDYCDLMEASNLCSEPHDSNLARTHKFVRRAARGLSMFLGVRRRGSDLMSSLLKGLPR